MKYFLLFILLILCRVSPAQDCKLVSRTSKKSSDVQSKGGSAPSENFTLLYLQKQYDAKNPDDTLNYSAEIIIGAHFQLKDSIINAGGKFEFFLANGETVVWDKAEASNLGAVLMTPYPNHIMFRVSVTKKQFSALTKSYIIKLRVFNIMETGFKAKSQKQLLSIADCLANTIITWD